MNKKTQNNTKNNKTLDKNKKVDESLLNTSTDKKVVKKDDKIADKKDLKNTKIIKEENFKTDGNTKIELNKANAKKNGTVKELDKSKESESNLKDTVSKEKQTVDKNLNKNDSTKKEESKSSNKTTNKKVVDKKEIKVDPIAAKKRQEFSENFDDYLEKSGLPIAFQIIFSEILEKKIQKENLFQYTAMRLRQIGNDIDEIKCGN
jgi:hypothetical protein